MWKGVDVKRYIIFVMFIVILLIAVGCVMFQSNKAAIIADRLSAIPDDAIKVTEIIEKSLINFKNTS